MLSSVALASAAVGVTTARAASGLEPPPQPCSARLRLNTLNKQRKIDMDTFGFVPKCLIM